MVMPHVEQLESQIAHFREWGYLILPDVLSPAQVMRINSDLDDDLRRNPWPLQRGHGHQQDADILPRLDALDVLLDHPAIVPLLRALVGDDVTLDEASVMFRDPVTQVPSQLAWHRDFGRSEHNPFGLHALSVIHYLSDVTATDHCFTLAPGTHDRWYDVPAQQHNPMDELDVHGPAGTTVLFHTACLHTARLRRNSTQRRTVHLYYGRASAPQVSRFTHIPPRLAQRLTPGVPETLFMRGR